MDLFLSENEILTSPIVESMSYERKRLYNRDQQPIKYFHNARGNPSKLELNVELISEESERKEIDSQPSEYLNDIISIKLANSERCLNGNISEDRISEPSNHKTESLDYSFSEDPSNLTYRISDSASGFNNSLADRLPKISTGSLTLSESSSIQPSNDYNFRSSLVEYRESIGQDSNPFDIMITEERESSEQADDDPIRIDSTTPMDSPKEGAFTIQQIKNQLNMKDIKFNFDTEEISGEMAEDSDYIDKKEENLSENEIEEWIESNENTEQAKYNEIVIESQGRSCSCNPCYIF